MFLLLEQYRRLLLGSFVSSTNRVKINLRLISMRLIYSLPLTNMHLSIYVQLFCFISLILSRGKKKKQEKGKRKKRDRSATALQ